MPDGFLTAFATILNALFLVSSVYIYLSLVRQIGARPLAQTDPLEKTFETPEAVLGVALATLFLVNAAGSAAASGKVVLRTNDLVANALVSLGVFVFVAAFLTLRGRAVNLLAGFGKLSFRRVSITGGILLFAAYPLIFLADLLAQRLLGTPSSKQGIVELFTDSQTLQQRILIIVLAIVVAPMVEEFVFRFFLYGVVKRYFGRVLGLAANSVLFAAVHAHVPSAAPLFVLGACFTIAYEWSGSILVPMTMHALFNSFTLVALAFPELFQQ